MDQTPDFSQTLQDLEAARGGDSSAAEELWDRYWEKLVPAVHIRLEPEMRNKVQTVDVVQSVFLEAVKEAEGRTFSTEGEFRHWLNKIVGEKIIRHKEKVKGLEEGLSGTILEEFSELDSMERALGQLASQARDIIVMHYFEGLGDFEISEKLGVDEETAQKRIREAVGALAREMDS